MEENRYVAKGLMTHVVPWEPTATTHSGNPEVVLLDRGYWRYNRLARDLTLDQVIAVSPFHDCLSLFPGLLGSAITARNAAWKEGTVSPGLPIAWISHVSESRVPSAMGGRRCRRSVRFGYE